MNIIVSNKLDGWMDERMVYTVRYE